MSTINANFITADSINDSKILLRNNNALKARNFADNANVDLLKLNASDALYFSTQPKFTGTASANDDLVNKGKLDTDLALYIPLTQKGAASGVAPLDAGGKIASSYLPSIAITDVFVVASEVAQLALTPVDEGDVVIRTDLSKSYIHNGGVAGTMADWTELLAPGTVVSVNGQTGTVSLDSDDLAEGVTNLYFTEARVRSSVLTGINTGSGGAVSAADSVLAAFGKLEYRVNLNDAKVSYSAATARTDLIASSIVDGDLTHAPDGNSVFDALALKSNTGHTHVAADVTDFASVARSSQRFVSEALVLTGTNITNGNVALSQAPIAQSENVAAGGLVQRRTSDYSISGSTLTFAGDMAAYLVAGDTVIVSYMY